MKKITAFAGSNSKQSINKQLAVYASGLVENATVTVLDLNDFQLPLYGIDYELDNGIPETAHQFFEHIKHANGIILSLAEHNGSYTVAFKNVLDWLSRIEKKCWNNLPMLLMSTSPGGRGGQTVLQSAKTSFPHLGAQLVADFSLPSFSQNFIDNTIVNSDLKQALQQAINKFKNAL